MNYHSDVLLVFPPVFYPHMPYLATASLLAALNDNNIKCHQLDLNLEFYKYILSQKFLVRCKEIIETKKDILQSEYEYAAHPLFNYVPQYIESALEGLKSSDVEEQEFSVNLINIAFDIISIALKPLSISFVSLKMGFNEFSSKDVSSALEFEKENIFFEFYDEIIPLMIKENKPKIICLSITAPTQIIHAFTLLKSIRKINSEIKLIIGGNVVTRCEDIFGKENLLSEYYDYAVIGEGENKLINLCKQLLSNDSRSVLSKKTISSTIPTSLEKLSTPNFDNLNLNEYYDKEPILPIYASRRCYWDRCSFCDIPYGYDSTHRRRTAEQVVKDIELLINKYGVKNFKFVDDAMPPEMMREISKIIIEKDLNIIWEAYVIIAKEFMEKEFCKLIYDAGCRWLYYGFESGDKMVISQMKKGHNVLNIKNVIKTTSEAGIKNHLWVIIGFPGEKTKNVEETVKFIEENHLYIDSLEINQFALVKHSAIIKNKEWEKFNIKPFIKEDEDLALYYDYETLDDSINQDEAKEIVINLRDYLFDKYGFSNAVRSSNLVSIRKNITLESKEEVLYENI